MMFIGGGADQPALMDRWMTLAGGKDQDLVVFPWASDDPARSGKAYVDMLHGQGASHVRFVLPADAPAALAGARGLFFSGGDQARILAGLTPAWRTAVAGAWKQGAAIAGTSAGAMVWGKTAILGGDPMATAWYGTDPAKDGLQLGAGLGFAPELVVDTHFSQRGRVPRLSYAVASQPGAVGLGVDPETAAILTPDGSVSVEGHGTVSMIRVPAQPVTAPLALHDVHLDLLAPGGHTTL